MEIINGLVALVLFASYIALAIDVRGIRKEQREYLDAILAELGSQRSRSSEGGRP